GGSTRPRTTQDWCAVVRVYERIGGPSFENVIRALAAVLAAESWREGSAPDGALSMCARDFIAPEGVPSRRTAREADDEVDHEGEGEGGPDRMPVAHPAVRGPEGGVPVRAARAGARAREGGERDPVRHARRGAPSLRGGRGRAV